MSDLISRSELISIIEREYREYGDDYDIEQILGDIEDMPTAYDIDKVVKEINEWTFNANIDVGDGTTMNHNLIVRDTAIEIVKAGVKNEN